MAKNLRFTNHETPDKVTQEFQNLLKILEEKVTFADRNPVTEDAGQLWVNYTTPALFVRNIRDKTWGAV